VEEISTIGLHRQVSVEDLKYIGVNNNNVLLQRQESAAMITMATESLPFPQKNRFQDQLHNLYLKGGYEAS
jgi:hypothetical protein